MALVTWQFAKIKPAVFASSQERGVAATFDIGSSECICSVPAEAALRIYPGRSPALGVAADVWQQLPWYAQVTSRSKVQQLHGAKRNMLRAVQLGSGCTELVEVILNTQSNKHCLLSRCMFWLVCKGVAGAPVNASCLVDDRQHQHV